VSAVVHHGGAGTTAAAMQAKVPNIIIPFGGDQPFWGNCVYRQGLGPKPIMRKRLTADNLSAAILEAVQNTQIIENSRRIGTLLRDENGVENAISVIEQKTCGRLPK